MKRLRLLVLLGLAATAALAQPRDDRRDDRRDDKRDDSRRDRNRGPRIIIYEHPDYRGASLVLYPGDGFEDLRDVRFENGGRVNDSISSVKVEGNAEIYVYDHPRFAGGVLRATENVRDLTTRPLPDSVTVSWNDRISSLRVEERRAPERRRNPDDILRDAYRDLLGREPELAGLGSLRSMIVDQGWSEEMVRDNLRRSDEFRLGGTRRLIGQAYADVLGREPRGDELARYQRKLLDERWLGADVREDLKRTDEYRRKPRDR